MCWCVQINICMVFRSGKIMTISTGVAQSARERPKLLKIIYHTLLSVICTENVILLYAENRIVIILYLDESYLSLHSY